MEKNVLTGTSFFFYEKGTSETCFPTDLWPLSVKPPVSYSRSQWSLHWKTVDTAANAIYIHIIHAFLFTVNNKQLEVNNLTHNQLPIPLNTVVIT